MAIVWPCSLSLDAYAAAGRELEIPRPDCPKCSAPMTRWSGYRRHVREAGSTHKIFVPRLRCGACAVTHALLPSFCLVKRLDAADGIGQVIEAVIDRVSGVRPVAARLQIPHTTARDFVRRFVARTADLALAFSSLCVELGGEPPASSDDPMRGALSALRVAFGRAAELPGWVVLGLWRFCSAVCGGRLIATNTISPYLMVGKRRFMPPVPNRQRKGTEDDRT